MLPENVDTERGRYLQNVIQNTRPGEWADWPMLTQPDYVLVGQIIVLFGYIDYNLRRIAEAADHAGMLKPPWKGKTARLTIEQPSMGGKWLETLKEIAPDIERVGFILNPETPPNVGFLQTAEAAAPVLKINVSALGVHNRDEIERAVTGFADEPKGGLIVAPHAITVTNSELIVELAARHRLPSIYPFASYAKAGGLVSNGFDPVDQFRQGAGYVDRILRGAQPSELPYNTQRNLSLSSI